MRSSVECFSITSRFGTGSFDLIPRHGARLRRSAQSRAPHSTTTQRERTARRAVARRFRSPARPGTGGPKVSLGRLRGSSQRDSRGRSDRRANYDNTARMPSHVEIDAESSGLSQISYARCEDVNSISEQRLIARLGAAPDAVMFQIARTLGFCSIADLALFLRHGDTMQKATLVPARDGSSKAPWRSKSEPEKSGCAAACPLAPGGRYRVNLRSQRRRGRVRSRDQTASAARDRRRDGQRQSHARRVRG
jgi:hypothetical protein